MIYQNVDLVDSTAEAIKILKRLRIEVIGEPVEKSHGEAWHILFRAHDHLVLNNPTDFEYDVWLRELIWELL